MDPILIVDDEKDNLEALQRLLRNQYEVTTATSPFEALKLIQKTHFHVIVSDQRMAEMTGVEFFEKAKNVAPMTSRILLTGYTDIDSVIGAINRGNVYRYVAKPWDPEELKQTMRQANEAYGLRQELDSKNEALSKSNAELGKALEDLRRLDRAKARFLSLISHELNTPLTVLTAFVSLLTEKKSELPTDVEKAVDAISKASQSFSEIVSEVLTYVRLEADSELHLREFDFAAETNQIKKDLEPLLKKKGISVVTKTAQSKVPVRCDGEKMKVALEKLFKDSILRSPNGRTVKIEVKVDSDFVSYSLWRTGEIISESSFEPLSSPSEPLHHHRNLGLGLAICRLIVEGHGGSLAVDSSQEAGTTVVLKLPFR